MSLVSGDPLISPCCGPSTLASLPWPLICLVSTHFSEAPASILPCLHQTVALCQPLGVGIMSSQSAVRFTPADLLHSLCRYIKSYLSSTLSRMCTPTWQLSSTRQPFHIIPFNISEWCPRFTYVWATVKIQTFPPTTKYYVVWRNSLYTWKRPANTPCCSPFWPPPCQHPGELCFWAPGFMSETNRLHPKINRPQLFPSMHEWGL